MDNVYLKKSYNLDKMEQLLERHELKKTHQKTRKTENLNRPVPKKKLS